MKAKIQLWMTSHQVRSATPANIAAGRKNMLATTWSKPIATNAMIGKKIARILPAMSSAPSAIQTARHTSQLQLRGQHAGLDRQEVGDEQRPQQVAEQHPREVADDGRQGDLAAHEGQR